MIVAVTRAQQAWTQGLFRCEKQYNQISLCVLQHAINNCITVIHSTVNASRTLPAIVAGAILLGPARSTGVGHGCWSPALRTQFRRQAWSLSKRLIVVTFVAKCSRSMTAR